MTTLHTTLDAQCKAAPFSGATCLSTAVPAHLNSILVPWSSPSKTWSMCQTVTVSPSPPPLCAHSFTLVKADSVLALAFAGQCWIFPALIKAHTLGLVLWPFGHICPSFDVPVQRLLGANFAVYKRRTSRQLLLMKQGAPVSLEFALTRPWLHQTWGKHSFTPFNQSQPARLQGLLPGEMMQVVKSKYVYALPL